MNELDSWRVTTRLLITMVAATVAACSAVAQQGRVGGFGGGMGGRTGMPRNAQEGELQTYSHILTPGDRGEWPFDVKDGETIIVGAKSTAFDPAIEVVDSKGKVLAENDDVRPGDQDALVLYRFEKGGAYKVLVKGFKSAGGGQYQFSVQRFVSAPAALATRIAGSLGKSNVKWFRFPVDAGQTMVVSARATGFDPGLQVYSPTGETVSARSQQAGRNSVRVVFRAAVKGDHYVSLSASEETGKSYALTVAAARVRETAIDAAGLEQHISPGGLDQWRFSGKPGDVILIDAHGNSEGVNVAFDFVTAPGTQAESASSGETGDAFSILPSTIKSPGQVIALLKKTGTYQATVSQQLEVENTYTISARRAIKAWNPVGTGDDTLGLGGSDYWPIKAKAGDILRVGGEATAFDIELELYSPSGEKVDSNDDGAPPRNALMTTLLTDTGTYLLRVHAFGDGGSGGYKVNRLANPVHPLQLGTRNAGAVGRDGSDIWSFTGKAGDRIIITVHSDEFDTAARLFGPDAVEVANNTDSANGADSLISARLPVGGTYTIWISSSSGSGKYTVRLITDD